MAIFAEQNWNRRKLDEFAAKFPSTNVLDRPPGGSWMLWPSPLRASAWILIGLRDRVAIPPQVWSRVPAVWSMTGFPDCGIPSDSSNQQCPMHPPPMTMP